MRNIILCGILALSASLFMLVSNVSAQESYVGTTINTPADWTVSQMKTFNGAVPSRAWIFERGKEEIFVSVMQSEGIIDGLKAYKEKDSLIKLYTESFIKSWGGEIVSETAHELSSAPFCGGEPGYKARAKFGTSSFVYYGCMKRQQDWQRIATVIFWQQTESDEEAAERITPFIHNIFWE